MTETANATPTTAAATDPEVNHDLTKMNPALADPQKHPETNYHRLHHPHPKSKKRKAKSSNATPTPPHAPQSALEAPAESPSTVPADANHLPEEVTANELVPPAALPTAKRLRGETAAVVRQGLIDTCLVEERLGRLRVETAVVIARGTRRSVGCLIGTFLGVGGRGVGVGLSSGTEATCDGMEVPKRFKRMGFVKWRDWRNVGALVS